MTPFLSTTNGMPLGQVPTAAFWLPVPIAFPCVHLPLTVGALSVPNCSSHSARFSLPLLSGATPQTKFFLLTAMSVTVPASAVQVPLRGSLLLSRYILFFFVTTQGTPLSST